MVKLTENEKSKLEESCKSLAIVVNGLRTQIASLERENFALRLGMPWRKLST